VPVVATRAGAIPEVVGDAALLVDEPDDVDALAEALQRVLTTKLCAATWSHVVMPATAPSRGAGPSTSCSACTRRCSREGRRHRRPRVVGRYLTRHLDSLGIEVVSLDVDDNRPVDITDRAAVAARIVDESPDFVYHLAARSHVGASWTDGDALTDVNVGGTRAVVDACVAGGVARVLVVGSAEQYGTVDPDSLPVDERTPCRPISPYGKSKVAAEDVALDAHRTHALHVVCTRAFNHTGAGQSLAFLVPGLAARIAAAERDRTDEIVLGNGDPVRDFRRRARRRARLRVARRTGCAGRGLQRVLGTRGQGRRRRRASDRSGPPPAARRDRSGADATADVPVLVGDPTKLVTTTGWQPNTTSTTPRRRPRGGARLRRPDYRDSLVTSVGAPLGTCRASQPRSVRDGTRIVAQPVAGACTSRSSELGRPASTSARASSTGTSASSTPCSTRSGRRSRRAAARTASIRPMSRTQRVPLAGSPRCGSFHRARVCEQPTRIHCPVAQRARRPHGRHPAHEVVVGGFAHRERAAVSESREPHAAHVGPRVQRAHRSAKVVEPPVRGEVALRRAGAAEVERQHRPPRFVGDVVGEVG